MKKISINFNDQAIDTADKWRQGGSVSDVVRKALALYDVVMDAKSQGKECFLKAAGSDQLEMIVLI